MFLSHSPAHTSPKFRELPRLLFTLLLAALLLPLPACDDRSPSAAPTGPLLRFVSSADHHHLDPQRMSWMHDIRIADCLFDPLVRLSTPDLTLQPATARHWTISPDGRTYRFTLRTDARWSNGDLVTAHDFLAAWRRAMLPDTAADYTQLFWLIRGARDFFHWRSRQLADYAQSPGPHDVQTAERLYREALAHFDATVGLHALDDHTLEVQLDNPTAYFLELCTFASFLPNHHPSLEKLLQFDPATGRVEPDVAWVQPRNLISNGPYTLARWRPKRDLLLLPNPNYYARDQLRNAGILERVAGNEQIALLWYQRREVDWLPDIPTAKPVVLHLLQGDRPDTHLVPAAGTYFYSFNCLPTLPDGTPNPLHDPRLRRALSLTIDRQTIVQKVTRLGDRQPIARTFIPPGAMPGYSPPSEAGAAFDPDAARRLLAQAGYPDASSLKNLSIIYNTGAGHENIAQQIAAAWRQHLGLNVKLEAMESKVFSERVKSHNFTICRSSWFGDYRDPTTFLDKMISDNGNNDTAYNNPAYDAILAAAARQPNPRYRLELLQEAESMMLGESPIAPIYHYVRFELFDPGHVLNLSPNPWARYRLELVELR
ncbi:MAG: peptide ABC transporter substrate-binding protein [Phycisphaeraceae bacterium]|nr:peptide ABC transporter substrate-binding protein [Phycisphaeraceae bacterium]